MGRQGWLLASDEQRPGMSLNIPQCTVQPQMSIVPRLGNLVSSPPWYLRNDLFYDLCIAFFPSTSV